MLYPKLSPAEVAGTDIAYAVPLYRDRRLWPLVAGLDQLDAAGDPAGRLGAGHHPWFLGREGGAGRLPARVCWRMTLAGVAFKLVY